MGSRVSSRSRFRGLAVAALVAGLFAAPVAGVSAQDDDAFEYDEDGVVYTVPYDSGIWDESSSSAVDVLLTSDTGNVVTFITDPELGDDVSTCLDDVVPAFEDGAGFDAAEDGDDPGAGDGDGYVYETRDVELSGESATTVHVCYDLGDGNLLWGASIIIDDSDADTVYDLLAGVESDGTTYDLDFAGGSARNTPEADDATPTSGGDADLETYESPNYGYTFDFDTAFWTDSEEGRGGGADGTRDQLRVSNDDESLVLFIEGSDEWTDTDDCVAVLSDEIGIDPETDTLATDPETGDDFLISDDDRSAAAYVGETDASGAVAYFDCYASPEGDVIVGFTAVASDVTEDEYFEDFSTDVQDVIDSLEFASNAV